MILIYIRIRVQCYRIYDTLDYDTLDLDYLLYTYVDHAEDCQRFVYKRELCNGNLQYYLSVLFQ